MTCQLWHEPAPSSAQTPRSSPRSAKSRFFHTSGSHYILKHPDKPQLRVTLAYHTKELKRKTLASIIEQAGFTSEEFIVLL